MLRRVLPLLCGLSWHSTSFLVEMYPMTDVRHKQPGFLYIEKMRLENEICGRQLGLLRFKYCKRHTRFQTINSSPEDQLEDQKLLKVVHLYQYKSMTNDNSRLLKRPLSLVVLYGQGKEKYK